MGINRPPISTAAPDEIYDLLKTVLERDPGGLGSGNIPLLLDNPWADLRIMDVIAPENLQCEAYEAPHIDLLLALSRRLSLREEPILGRIN